MWPVPEPPGEVWSCGAELCQGWSAIWLLHWLLQEPRRHPVLPPAFWTRMQYPGTLRRSEVQLEGDVGSPWSPLHLSSSHSRP